MQSSNSSPVAAGQTITPGTSISALGSSLLIVCFFMPWFTACNVEVSGMQVALQQNPQGQQSAIWLLGIPLVGLVGVILALTALNKPLAVVASRAKVILGLAFYPLLGIGLLYLGLRGPQQPGQVDLRQIIQFEFGFWGTILASLAMIAGAILDIASARGRPAARPSPLPAIAAPAKPPPAVAIPPVRQPISPPVSQPPPPARQPRAWLEGQSGEWARQRVEISGDTLTIGRHHTNDLHLSDKAVSRQHAVIRCGRGRYFIQDQDSTIGTYVNGQQVSACELKPGDVVRIGETEFRFHVS